jgi:RHS repeat-associated protein
MNGNEKVVGGYYPFGFTMAGISSKALSFGEPKNKEETFQGQRFDDELGLNWVQFKWRNHDPQIGRFLQIDPLAEEYVYNSTYAFSENKVTSHVELEGLEASWAGFGQHVPVDKWEGFH